MSHMTITNRVACIAAAALALLALPAAGSAQEDTGLSDAQIAHVAFTANDIEVETAKLAERRAQNAEVKAFAQMLIDDHSAANERADSLAERIGLTREDNDRSQSMREEAEKEVAKFDDLAGLSFDRSYIGRQVELHREVLDVLDRELIPNAQNAELKALLNETRPTVQRHLEQAEALDRTLHQGDN